MSDDLLNRVKEALANRYEVESELDRGGMAVVYLAKDLRHDRMVAIKILYPSLSATLGTERFLREIDVIAKLVHPNILTLIDSGVVEDLPYYVMPFVKGQSLAALLEREGTLPFEQAARIACEVAEALEVAHQQGVVHRDIKPSNVLLSGGHAVVADFGIAVALDESKLNRLTRAGTSIGSPVYMSPEQAGGEGELDGRADIYALGCMLYEMLCGEAPFQGSLEAVVARKVVGEVKPLREVNPEVLPPIEKVVSRAMERVPDNRFSTAGAFREALQAAMPKEESKGLGRKRTLFTMTAVVVVAVAAFWAVWQNRAESKRQIWAAQTLAEVEELAYGGKYSEAYRLAQEVEAVLPEDTTLGRLIDLATFTRSIHSDPSGATVFAQDWEGEGGGWELLGQTPLDSLRWPGSNVLREDGPHRFRFELDGYQTREVLSTLVFGASVWRGHPAVNPVPLLRDEEDLRGSVPVPGFSSGDTLIWSDYLMDQYEVTNQEFKVFLEAGGYEIPEYWVHPLVVDGEVLSFDEAMEGFRDQSGRNGPSTWRLGTYPEGQEDYPVGGVSWYEAAAFAEWAGKELPTTWHWWAARRYDRETSFMVLPRSNLDSDGPRPVGQNEAMSGLGIYDMAGNVREWCYNETENGQRSTMGAAWTDGDFHVGWVIPKPPGDRHATNGIRLVRTTDSEELMEVLRFPEERTTSRDYWAEEPASDERFEDFRRLYAYDPYPLNPTVDRVDTLNNWIRSRVWFDVPYGERGGAVLFFPKSGEPPYQAVISWGGSNVLSARSSENLGPGNAYFLVLDGRVVARPLFKGGYERDDSLFSITHLTIPGGRTGPTYRDLQLQWVKDLTGTIEYLETREDIDAEKMGYFGFSFGGQTAPIVLAVESRIKAAVLNVGGFTDYTYMPEIDPFNFVTRVRTPTLMINGRYDIVFPYETMQLPMFEMLGTREEDKRHYLVQSSHIVPADDLIRETLAFFDEYLGVPGSR